MSYLLIIEQHAMMYLNTCTKTDLKVKVGSRDSEGKELSKGDAIVRGKLIPVIEKGIPIEAGTTDHGDGTYLVSLSSQQICLHNSLLLLKICLYPR